MFALRGRYRFSHWRNLPPVFPNGLAGSPNRDELTNRVGIFMKAVAYSAAGILVGQGVGALLGSWRSTQILKQEGNYANIEAVMKRVQQDLRDNYGKLNEGREDAYSTTQGRSIPPSQRRKLQQVDPMDLPSVPKEYSSQETARLERAFEPDSSAVSDRAWSDASFSKDMGPGNDGFYGGGSSSSSGRLAGESSSPISLRTEPSEILM